jgi:hypothetical protein
MVKVKKVIKFIAKTLAAVFLISFISFILYFGYFYTKEVFQPTELSGKNITIDLYPFNTITAISPVDQWTYLPMEITSDGPITFVATSDKEYPFQFKLSDGSIISSKTEYFYNTPKQTLEEKFASQTITYISHTDRIITTFTSGSDIHIKIYQSLATKFYKFPLFIVFCLLIICLMVYSLKELFSKKPASTT